ncbi:type I-E CRISPR-associated protein Cas6/Cse3/CasE [Urinicoccus timonensis]|uniref:type I-E CRISPR-associated protein Cas6/Cse3/CasE n=1 Tax=Urinicoccus timonensis TaxID=2024205 RepID=UPI000C079389|nr:type I-E CRISPR-associated protein Cas6/Cse3/CasE [Urinicoccus timonensis]
MYISRVKLDLDNRKNLRDLSHLGCYHGWIEDSFPDERGKGNRSRKLWRIDSIHNEYYLLVLSEEKPEESILEKYAVKGSLEIKDYDPFIEKLREGMQAKFRIKLNTVKSLADRSQGRRRGRLVPVPLDELIPYFLSRAEKNGFHVDEGDLKIVARSKELFEKQDQEDTRIKLDLVSTSYEGLLTITDLEKFKKALTQGIGKKKAYGFGLLTIIPYHG